jgi:hypothetical protein
MLGTMLAACAGGTPTTLDVEPIVNFTLPPVTAGCGGAVPLAGGAERLPITVSTTAGQTGEMINVCIAGHGPYPFVIDSGAGETVIDAELANRLHLPSTGPATAIEGVGCTADSHSVMVDSWSAAGAPLVAQTITAAHLPDFGIKGQPVGLLGSDVLSRFGAVRIDFGAQTLTLGGPEAPAVTNSSVVNGPIATPPPAVLTTGGPGTTVPLKVNLSAGAFSMTVRVRIKGPSSHNFVIDTGSSQSVVASAIASAEHLSTTKLAQRQTTVCSIVTVPLVHSGAWSLPSVALRPQLIGAVDLGPISSNGTVGLIGSDVLKEFGWVILDYSGGRLILG